MTEKDCTPKIQKLVEAWRDMPADEMRLRCGEMTAQEVRTVRAVLNQILPANEKSPDAGEKGKAADRSHPTACSSFCHPAEKCCITEDGKCDALREVVGVDSLRLVSGSFTPGPWVWAWEQRILNSAHGKILDCEPCEGMWFARYNDQEDAANARLIAAAPDLLEALQNLENDDGSIPDHAWKLCQRAISKAIPSANDQAHPQMPL